MKYSFGTVSVSYRKGTGIENSTLYSTFQVITKININLLDGRRILLHILYTVYQRAQCRHSECLSIYTCLAC